MKKLRNLLTVLLCIYTISGMASIPVCFVVEATPGSPSTPCKTVDEGCCNGVCSALRFKNDYSSPHFGKPKMSSAQKKGTRCSDVFPHVEYFVGDSTHVNVDGGHVAVCHCNR